MKINNILVIAIATVMTITSCKKEGPEGPQGPAGPTGVAGPTGPQGPQGNANVNKTEFTVTPGDWSTIGTSGQPGYGFAVNIGTSILTQSILDNGAVMVYMKNGSSWVALPTTIYYGSYSTNFLFQHAVNSVQIEMYDSDLATVSPSTTMTFKIVAIAGGFIKANPDLDLKDYSLLSVKANLD